jgi:glycosyltransferase involved in cell wall biosynthesis
VKRLQIAVMPRKRAFEVKFIRDTYQQAFGEHRDVPWVILDSASEGEVAETLRHSAVFLSMNRFEGFGLPPLEAMACGCIVVGFHGWGALDYARSDNGFWCEEENLTECVKKLGEVCTLFKKNGEILTRMRYRAMETAAEYRPERQRDMLLDFWWNVMG